MTTIPTDFDQLAHAIALATVHSDIEIYAARVTVDGHEYWDTTRPRHDSETPDEDLAYLQRAMSYIDKAGDVFPQRTLRHIAAPGLVRFVKRDQKTADDGACYCQEDVVCPACERATPGIDLPEVNELLRIWQTHFDSGVRPDDDEPEDAALWDRIAAVRTAIDQQAGKATAPAASIQILIEWIFRRFGAAIDAGELPDPVVTAVREIERWLNPLLPMPEAPR